MNYVLKMRDGSTQIIKAHHFGEWCLATNQKISTNSVLRTAQLQAYIGGIHGRIADWTMEEETSPEQEGQK